MEVPTIYFVRHGETDWNAEGRLQGQLDVPVNALGCLQAEEAGKRLSRPVPAFETLDYVASPLSRTRETMERLRRALALRSCSYRMDERLKELSFGGWEGLTWKEVRSRHPQDFRAREKDTWRFVPPGGESYAMLADRIRPVLGELSRDTVVVSHGGVARVFLALLGHVPAEKAPRVDVWQGRVLVFEGGRHRWV